MQQLPVTVQAKHLFATNLIDDVVIGNVYASNEELEALGQLNRYQTELTIVFEEATSEIEKEIVIKNQHFRRGDITQQMIRSTEVRKKYKEVKLIPHMIIKQCYNLEMLLWEMMHLENTKMNYKSF